jgi:putative holliday junction resolvase
MRVMALDPGSQRIGVAVSDETGLLASPVAVVERTTRARDLDRLRALVDQYRPAELLVGVPRLASGDLGPQARRNLSFGERIGQALGLPVRWWNESYSTVEARRRLAEAPHRRRRSAAVDAEAAAVFLQEYLDSVR